MTKFQILFNHTTNFQVSETQIFYFSLPLILLNKHKKNSHLRLYTFIIHLRDFSI